MAMEVQIGANIESLRKGLKAASGQLDKFESTAGKAATGVSNAFTGLGGKLAGLASTGAIISLGRQVLNTTAEFQKFGAVLGNTLGSKALSDLKLNEIQKFAAQTPFGVQELTGAFVKLANQGFKPTGDQMRKLGDLAASTGKTFDQLAEAVLDGQVGEYERLKEFGIRAKDAGDKVIFTFKGVQTTVEKSSGAIREYITSLGAAEGVSGSMAKISETLTGKISNLGDKWDQMLVSIGGNTTGVFSQAMDVIGDAIDKVSQYNKQLELTSKYKLSGSNFGQELNRALNPFADKGGTDVEKQIAGITIAQEETTKFVSSAIAGAKSAADFGKAIKTLAQMGKDYANLHLGSEGFTKGEQRGIIDQYQQGIKALQDARTKFLEDSKKGPEGNFGKTSEKKTPADILKQLGYDLEKVKSSGELLEKTFQEGRKSQIEAIDKAVGGLIDLGQGKSTLADSLRAEAKALQDPLANITGQISTASITVANSMGQINTQNLLPLEESLRKSAEVIPEHLNTTKLALEGFNNEVSNILNNGLVATLSGVSEAIGYALANGTSVIDSVGNSLLQSLGNILSQLGVMALETGLAIKAIKTAITNLQPGPAIAAGIALLAVAGVVKAKANKLGNSMGSGGSGSVGGSFSPGAMPSRYQPSTLYSSNSHSYIPTYSPSQEIRFRITGYDLVAAYERSKAHLARTRG